MKKRNVKENSILDFPDEYMTHSEQPRLSDYDIDRKLYGLPKNWTDEEIDKWRAEQQAHNAEQSKIIDAAQMNSVYESYAGNEPRIIESLLKRGFSENQIIYFLSNK